MNSLLLLIVLVTGISWPFMSQARAHDGHHGGHGHDHAIIVFHGISPPDKEHMMINTKPLKRFSKTHHLLVACTSSDEIPRAGRETPISKSATYPITGDKVRIETTLTRDFLRFGAKQSRTMLTCFPAIIPVNVQPDHITMLESVYTVGGQFIGGGVAIRADSLFRSVKGTF